MATGSWAEWSKYVLKELERQDGCHKELVDKFEDFRDCVKKEFKNQEIAQAVMKVKVALISSLIGAVAGSVITIIGALIVKKIMGVELPPIGIVP